MQLVIDLYFVIMVLFYTFVLTTVFSSMYVERRTTSDYMAMTTQEPLVYFFLIPCIDEDQVIQETVTRLCSFNFDGQVIVIDDGSTDRTADCVRQVKDARVSLHQRQLPNAQQGKGEALNDALQLVLATCQEQQLAPERVVIGVLDADAYLSNNALDAVAKSFYFEGSTAVQLRVKMKAPFKNALQVAQDAEFFTINNYDQIARKLFQSVGLSGNGQFFRLKPILDRIGKRPWGRALLDDYELTLKLMIKHLKVDYVADAYVYQEALFSIPRLIKQRSRWVQGNLDCLKYVKPLWKEGHLRKSQWVSILYFLTQPYLNLVSDSVIIILFSDMLYRFVTVPNTNWLNSGLLLLGVFGASLVLGVIFTLNYRKTLRHFHEDVPPKRHLMVLPLFVSYMYVILFFSIILAFYRKLMKQNDWIKTKRN
ncbi:glycosyltransferase [Latilactobacillus fuchuensis]|uniref:glycosyltransferase n=1 Tax=Latilactobacillus fuchuensis TaxID=164393 RepID=UPI0039B11329